MDSLSPFRATLARERTGLSRAGARERRGGRRGGYWGLACWWGGGRLCTGVDRTSLRVPNGLGVAVDGFKTSVRSRHYQRG